MRRLLQIIIQLVLLGGVAHAQIPNHHLAHRTENTIAIAKPDVLHIFEYSMPRQTVLLEFYQDECQASVTEEYIIPDVPADPSKLALTMFFDALCDLGLSAADTAHSPSGPVLREMIEEILVSPDNSLMVVQFAAG
jgi:hypothetical protein